MLNDLINSLICNNIGLRRAGGPGAGDARRISVDEVRSVNQIESMLLKTQEKQNWNFFVGDPRYKTDFFLQFINRTTENIYVN